MAFSYSFVDSKVYGTDDINNIAANLTGAGIAPFLTKDSYNASDLNALTSALVEGGPCLDGCLCSAKDIGTAQMYITVSRGILYFASGVQLTVDEEGYDISVAPNTAGYIYAHHSPTLQKADIVFDSQLPINGEYILLAEISVDGKLKDKRNFARSKVATFGSNAVYPVSQDRITIYESESVAPSYSDTEIILGEIDLSGIDLTKFNYLIYRYTYSGIGSTSTGPSYCEKYYSFKENIREKFYVENSLYYTNAMFDILLEGSKILILVQPGNAQVLRCYKEALYSAISYFKLV